MSLITLPPRFHAFTTNLDKTEIPKNIYEVLKVHEWKKVITEELRALEKNETWDVTKPPKGVPMGHKWVFTIKYKAYRMIER